MINLDVPKIRRASKINPSTIIHDMNILMELWGKYKQAIYNIMNMVSATYEKMGKPASN